MKTLLEYLGQESTWRGLVALAMAFGISVNPEQAAHITAAGMFIIGTINTLKKK